VRQAKLIDRLVKAEPKVLAVDIFYPERESKKADAALARTLVKGRGTIVMAAGFDVVPGAALNLRSFLLDNALTNIKTSHAWPRRR